MLTRRRGGGGKEVVVGVGSSRARTGKKKKREPRPGREVGRGQGRTEGKKIEPQEDRKINVTVTPFIKNN